MSLSFESKIQNLIKQGINRFYIYPFGNRGRQIYDLIRMCYEDIELIRVDNELCQYNKNIISYNKLKEIIKDNTSYKKEVVLISSDNSKIYRELRLTVSRDIEKNKIVDLFENDPLIDDNDKRIAALVMAAKQIYMGQIGGSVAEAGVYKGEFAKKINMMFPDRNLYLFDTFEGFVQGQVLEEKDNKNQTNSWIDTLNDTAAEAVFQKMPYKNKVKIYKGIFPDTAYDINESFAFVNLDMDLYYPIYEGLKFFWKHLNPGGIIFVHDYGNWDGVTAAVRKFCQESKIGYIWLNDGTTVAISKPLEVYN